jgi:hypothetical protein
MNRLSLITVLTLVAITTFAQDFDVPQNLTLRTNEDYVAQEPNVMAAIDWLMKTPPGDQKEKRQDVDAFLLKWMTGTKAISMGIDSEILTFMESSPDLLTIFMAGWIKNALETKEGDDQVSGNIHGLEAVVDYYTKFKQSSAKDKHVEKYVKMKAEGTLSKFIEKNVRH